MEVLYVVAICLEKEKHSTKWTTKMQNIIFFSFKNFSIQGCWRTVGM